MVTADGYVYARIGRAWYGIKEAGFLSIQTIVKLLLDGTLMNSPIWVLAKVIKMQ